MSRFDDAAAIESRLRAARRRVLFVVQERAHYRDHRKLAAVLSETGRYEPEFAVLSTYDRVEEDQADSAAAGYAFHYDGYAAGIARRYRFVNTIVERRERMEAQLIAAGYLRPRDAATNLPQRHFLDLSLLAGLICVANFFAVRKLRRLVGIALFPLLWLGKRSGLRFHVEPETLLNAATLPIRWLLRPLLRGCFNRSMYAYDKAYVAPLRIFVFHFRRLRKFKALLQSRRIGLLVLAEDNVGHATGAFTRAAKSLDIPVVTIPYTIANAREFAESYYDSLEHQLRTWPNRLIARRYPQYVYEHRGRKIMRLPGWQALVQELLGIAPPRPWAYNSGRSDAIVVESEHTVEYYRRAGLVSEPLLPLGTLFDDDMANVAARSGELRRRLDADFALDPTKPLLVCALPPNQLPSRPRCPYKSFADLVRAWVAPLAELRNYNVVVSLHPRLKRAELQFIESEFGIPIVDGPTSQLVPLCDVYLASVSATIRWAIACGKPVVNYDVFDYRYDDYDDAPGVVTIASQREYQAVLRRLAAGDAYREQLRDFQLTDRHRWGNLDGGATNRITALFDALCGKNCETDHENGRRRTGANGSTTSASRERQAT